MDLKLSASPALPDGPEIIGDVVSLKVLKLREVLSVIPA